jgi:hypothetical protein
MSESASSPERRAECLCGSLKVTARGEHRIYACSCVYCQRRSGSAFTYAAIYSEDAVTIAVEHKAWGRRADSGRFIENRFCPTCGVTVFFSGDGFPGMIGIAAGCFADRDFPQPDRLYWALRRHHWLLLCENLTELPTQPDVPPPSGAI